jgi:antitoxin CcdA
MVQAIVTRVDVPSKRQSEKAVKVTRLPINVSRVGERGLREEVQEIKARKWSEQNAELVSAYTAMVEREGLPLAKYRTF